MYQVVQYKVMETVGNSSYLLVNEEKGVIPHGQRRVMGFCVVVMRPLDECWTWCCGPISTNTGRKRRWTMHMGALQYVILYHKEHISNKKTLQLLL